jgi:lycopene cyclase domain-containing protein
VSYFGFHLIFLLPSLAVAAFLARGMITSEPRRCALALGAVCTIAVAYTTPWDQYLIARGIWTYDSTRVAGTVGYVPIEEYVFFLLQPLLAGLVYLALQGDGPGRPAPAGHVRRVRLGLVAFWLLASAAGAFLLSQARGTYLGLILIWAGPVLAAQAFVVAAPLVRHWKGITRALLLTTLYLCIADRIAIGAGIWSIAVPTSTGLTIAGLPIEEVVFFLLTDVLVLQGLLLFLFPQDVRSAFKPSARRGIRDTAPAVVAHPTES